jgi:hypothetical protein
MSEVEAQDPSVAGRHRRPVSLAAVERLLQDDAAVRIPELDPELEALHRAILLEQVFEVVLADRDLGPAALRDTPAVHDAVIRAIADAGRS